MSKSLKAFRSISSGSVPAGGNERGLEAGQRMRGWAEGGDGRLTVELGGEEVEEVGEVERAVALGDHGLHLVVLHALAELLEAGLELLGVDLAITVLVDDSEGL